MSMRQQEHMESDTEIADNAAFYIAAIITLEGEGGLTFPDTDA
jgi:hypothetical protein